MSLAADYFDELFAESDDPWAFRTRWYEQRKRDLTLAALPRQRYARVFEPGCANGELSLRLAHRCDELIGMDMSARAVALARKRLSEFPRATIVEGCLPDAWPEGKFDLIVVSEWAYYLPPALFVQVIERIASSLTPDGAVLACHWLHPIEGCPMLGRETHALLAEHLQLQPVVRHEETDFLLEMWSKQSGRFDLAEQVR
ncbi:MULTISPECIES: class I SAM-dependent DNA methyltransferase [unclassified Pseudomonas]|uniref:class I SAM-dependent DNA methyltransferase n=1 Tax=unclassified Pseudomonas TaxID=196821 RepID=UPI0025DC20A8|nr:MULTISPECIES: class I SAM-dependent methyltransferase [unclassified Pseudomonas]